MSQALPEFPWQQHTGAQETPPSRVMGNQISALAPLSWPCLWSLLAPTLKGGQAQFGHALTHTAWLSKRHMLLIEEKALGSSKPCPTHDLCVSVCVAHNSNVASTRLGIQNCVVHAMPHGLGNPTPKHTFCKTQHVQAKPMQCMLAQANTTCFAKDAWHKKT